METGKERWGPGEKFTVLATESISTFLIEQEMSREWNLGTHIPILEILEECIQMWMLNPVDSL